MRHRIAGIFGIIITVVLLVLYMPPLVLFGILDIGNIIGFILAALALIFTIQQFGMAGDDAPKREYDKSVSGGTRGRLHRQYNHDMGRSTVLIERGGLGNFTADSSIGYDGDQTSHAGLIVWIVILILIIAFFAQGFVRIFSVNESSASKSKDQNVVVLGCGVRGNSPTIMLRQRIEAARLFLEENPDAYAVLSGGQGPDEDISEAECMKEYLTDKTKAAEDAGYFDQACNLHGVNWSGKGEIPVIDESRILLDSESVNTNENIQNSISVLQQNGRKTDNLVIVTQWYHEYRAMQVAQQNGVTSVSAYPAAIDWWNVATYTTRECASLLYHTIK